MRLSQVLYLDSVTKDLCPVVYIDYKFETLHFGVNFLPPVWSYWTYHESFCLLINRLRASPRALVAICTAVEKWNRCSLPQRLLQRSTLVALISVTACLMSFSRRQRTWRHRYDIWHSKRRLCTCSLLGGVDLGKFSGTRTTWTRRFIGTHEPNNLSMYLVGER